jgi:Zn-dependent protease with chaperone function
VILRGRDPQTGLLLACMWIDAYLLLFGLEARSYLEEGRWFVPLLGIVGLGAAALWVERTLNRRATSTATIESPSGNDGSRRRRKRVPLVAASAAARAFVAERTGRVGLDKQPRVLRVPNTWTSIEAYAVGTSKRPVIVLTSGAQHLAAKGADRIALEFLVDHELAHITQGDPAMLYQALALIITVATVLPLKLICTLVILRQRLYPLYAGIFPRGLSVQFTKDGQTLHQHALTFETIAAGIGTYSLALTVLLALLYVSITRRREYWADRIARTTGGHSEAEALGAFDRLFDAKGRTLAERVLHPAVARRRANLADLARRDASYQMPLAFLWVASMWSFRFALGNNALMAAVETY